MPSHVARRQAHNAASPFLHGVQEGLFPRFLDTMGRSDSQPPLSPRFVAFAWRYHRLRRGWLPAIATHDRGHQGVDDPVPEPEIAVETVGSPRFPGTPRVPWPCSPTPVRPNMPGHCGVSAWSPRLTRARTLTMIFRGSIARPWHSLSTLRSEGHPSPRKTRFRLPAKLCRAGFVTRRVPMKGFRVSSLVLPS